MIERLFARLQAMYGQQFISMWEKTNVQEVKGMWAEKLGGFNAEQIGKALVMQEENHYARNLPDFLGLCRRAAMHSPAAGQYAEPIPATKEEAARLMAKIEQRMGRQDKPKGPDYRGWAKKIIDRKVGGDRVPHAALKAAQEVYRGAA